MHTPNTRFIALDVETTGVDFQRSQVIQCGVVFLTPDLQETGTTEWNINYDPDAFDWNVEAEEIHGIPKEQARIHGISIDAFLTVFEKELFKHYGIGIDRHLHIIAANAHFDFMMLKLLWEMYRKTPFLLSHRFADINSAGLVLFGEAGMSRLMDILNIENDKDKRHGALYDAQLHLAIFNTLRSYVKRENSDQSLQEA